MKLKITTGDLLRAISASSRVLGLRANLPILSNILISAQGSRLEALTTNLETAVKASVKCFIESDGKTTVPGKVFFEYVSQLPDQELSLEKLGEEVVLTTRGYKARFATMPPEEFPAIPKISSGKEIKMNKDELIRGAELVAFSAAQDESRPILTGVFCEVGRKGMVMVATDGYRLSYLEAKIEGLESLVGIKFVVPARALVEAARLVGEAGSLGGGKGDMVEITVADSLNQINFKAGDVEFTSRLIEGEFPSWQKIIPGSFASRVMVNKPELVNIIKTAAIFARESGSIVKLKIDSTKSGEGMLEVSAATSQVGSGDAKVAVKLEGKAGEIAFNFRYLLEVLSVIGGEEVVFEMNESLNPGKITPLGPKDKYFHIIMPVRLQG